ncbi:hypothetical protein GCM10022252_76550 [Streptosporangium oxazolinicum]|uniref:Uncharacterized protein n=1 Tax=Streptosporangium oxazolinicum TaxID=909287 RepID=A0ABP8BLU5_9ACTN
MPESGGGRVRGTGTAKENETEKWGSLDRGMRVGKPGVEVGVEGVRVGGVSEEAGGGRFAWAGRLTGRGLARRGSLGAGGVRGHRPDAVGVSPR